MNFHDFLVNFRDVVDKEVEGWFYPIDIVMMHGIMAHMQGDMPGDICEIGVAYGKSAILMSTFRKNEKFYLYDIFSEEQRKIAEANIAKFGNANNLEWRLQDTTDLIYDDLNFDSRIKFLHIDGCHEHPAVLNDLILFSSKMEEYGVIVVDDYNDYEYPGVNSGTIEFILSKANYNNWRVFAVGDNKAYLCHKKLLRDYQERMISYIELAKEHFNVPFPITYGVRQVCDSNVLLCDSRMKWDKETTINNLFKKPIIG